MRAVALDDWGGPEVLHEVDLPTPRPGPGEVRIRVHAVAVNPSDTKYRAGQRPSVGPGPHIPGMDAAGVIDALGPDSDGRLSIGDRVVALAVPGRPGTYADQIVLPEASVVTAPTGVELSAAATLIMNGATARLALDQLGLRSGQTLAVTGAAGALGGYLVQWGKADGLRVIADAKDTDRDLVASLGADEVVPRGANVAQAITAVEPTGVDGVADAALQNEEVVPAIRDGGALAVFRGWEGPDDRGITTHKVQVAGARTDTALLQRVRDAAERGELTLRVADVLPAGDAPIAHRRLEAGGVRGRLVLDFTR